MNRQPSLFPDDEIPPVRPFPYGKDITAKRHRDNAFSKLANQHLGEETKSQMRERVFLFVAKCRNGATTEEIADALRMKVYSVSARMSELKAQGRLQAAGRRHTTSGASAGVWKIR